MDTKFVERVGICGTEEGKGQEGSGQQIFRFLNVCTVTRPL